MNLTTIASLPGSGGGLTSWQRPERVLAPARKVEIAGLDYLESIIKPIVEQVKAKSPGRNDHVWVTTRGEHIKVIHMGHAHIERAMKICYKNLNGSPYNGHTAQEWIEIFQDELYLRSRNS